MEGEPGACPSLRDVSEHILGLKLPDTHDSVQDAKAALDAAVYIMQYGVPSPISRSGGGAGGVPANQSLLLHRIPDGCTEEQLFNMLLSHTHVVPTELSAITKAPAEAASASPGPLAGTGKCVVTFSSVAHADLAFESVAGPNRPDKSNRAQKRIYTKGGGYICVRKC